MSRDRLPVMRLYGSDEVAQIMFGSIAAGENEFVLLHFNDCQTIRGQIHRQFTIVQLANVSRRQFSGLSQGFELFLGRIARLSHLVIGRMHVPVIAINA